MARPPKADARRSSLHVRVTDAEYDRLATEAYRAGVPLSELARVRLVSVSKNADRDPNER